MRQSIILALGVIAVLFGPAAQGQAYPNKSIHFVVTTVPGGAPDVLARVLGQKVSESLGQQIVVDNRMGAGGIVAAESVINSAPDGYTLLVADVGVYAIAPHLSRDTSFEPLKNLIPVTLTAIAPIYLSVNTRLNVSSLKEFIALAKARPGLSYGSSGIGTAHHLAMELLKSLAGINLIHVPYKGAAQTTLAMVGGEVDAGFLGMSSALPQAKAGKLKILAVSTANRTALMPDIPTLTEAGIPGIDIGISIGFFAPLKTPREIVDKLSAELVKAVKSADVRQRLSALGMEPVGTTAEQFADAVRNEYQAFGKLVKTTGVRAD